MSFRAKLLLSTSLLWVLVGSATGLALHGALRVELERQISGQLLASARLAAATLEPALPARLQPESATPALKERLARALSLSGGRNLAVLDARGVVLADATGEAAPGFRRALPQPGELGQGYCPPARQAGFGLWEQSAFVPLGRGGLVLELDADPGHLRILSSFSARFLLFGLAGLALSLGLSLAVALRVRLRESALAGARQLAEARAEERLQLAGGIAHESRNALGAIQGQAEWLEAKLEDPALKDAAAKILVQTRQIGSVLERLLEYSRPLRLEKAPLKAKSLLEDLAAELKALGLDPRVECPPGLILNADAALLGAALGNLARNAAEAAPKGSEVILSAAARGSKAELALEDRGPGVASARREEIFRPFISDKPGGTGLGLSLVEKVAAAHAGSARVETGARGGARFVIEIPL